MRVGVCVLEDDYDHPERSHDCCRIPRGRNFTSDGAERSSDRRPTARSRWRIRQSDTGLSKYTSGTRCGPSVHSTAGICCRTGIRCAAGTWIRCTTAICAAWICRRVRNCSSTRACGNNTPEKHVYVRAAAPHQPHAQNNSHHERRLQYRAIISLN